LEILKEDEIKIYHIMCDISKICRDYFFVRKHLPNDCWSVNDIVKSISISTKELKSEYTNAKKNLKLNNEWKEILNYI